MWDEVAVDEGSILFTQYTVDVTLGIRSRDSENQRQQFITVTTEFMSAS